MTQKDIPTKDVFLLRSICGDYGNHHANTIPELPAHYADKLVEAGLARKPSKADREKAAAFLHPMISPKNMSLPDDGDGADVDGESDAE